MNINTDKPIVFFDLETTGLDITNDQIIEIGLIKYHPNGEKESLNYRVKPSIEISEESQKIHGISMKDLADKPMFNEIAKEIVDFIGNSDLAGYNSNKFDIPLLAEELLRAGVKFELSDRNFIDVQNIFHKKEQRTLEAAYLFYCNKTLENAHSALDDTQATAEILFAQLNRYTDLERETKALAEFSNQSKNKLVDFAGRLAKNNEGEVIYNFGKHKGKTVAKVAKEEPGYYGWMLDANFPLYTKEMLRKEMQRIKALNAEKETPHKPYNKNQGKKQAITEQDLEALKRKFGKL